MNKYLINLADLLPLCLLRKASGVNPLIVNYHMVSDERLPHIIHLYKYRDTTTFIRDLDFYTRHYAVIGLPALLESIANKTKLPANSLLITFDDGFREIFDVVAPILLQRKLPATFFITKNFLDNYQLNHDNKKSLIIERLSEPVDDLTRTRICEILGSREIRTTDIRNAILNIPYSKRSLVDQIGHLLEVDFTAFLKNVQPYMTTKQTEYLLSEGFTLGGHSIDHAKFTELSLQEQIDQAISSVEFVNEKFHIKYSVFAFPYSDNGISIYFFNSVSDRLDATFGTQGLFKDCVPKNFQRMSVEKLQHAASAIVKYNYSRKILYRMVNRDLLHRDDT